MTKQTNPGTSGGYAAKASACAVLALVGAVALAGCEQHPYPSPAPDESAPAPTAPAPLSGAPTGPDGQPVSGPAAPSGASPSDPDTAAPPVASPPPGGMIGAAGPNGARVPCPPDASQAGPNAPTVIICSAPVPNPTEGEAPEHRHHRRHWRFGAGGTPAHSGAGHVVRRYHHHHHGHRLAHLHAAPQAGDYGYVVHNHHRYRIERPVAPTHGHRLGSHAAAKKKPPAVYVVPGGAAPLAHPSHKVKAPPPPAGDANTTAAGTTASPTEAQRYGDLQTALTAAIGQNAHLAPSPPFGAQTTDVALTLPSDFAQTVRTEAAKQDLSDQATSVNIGATLTGDGYTITPAQAQSQPLTLGEQTVFHWKVTRQQNASGPLQANVRADILSAGRSLQLGAVTSSTNAKWTGRVVGVGLLVLIALALLAWAAQRKRPKASGAARPRENHQTAM